ncbi:PDDEXK nuclease domain-containing protein [Streptomyces sp. NPDC002403]
MYGASLYAVDDEPRSKAVAHRKAHPEHFGQLGSHVPVVDDPVRDKEFDGPTVGIPLAGSRDRPMVEYALRGRNQPPAVSTYAVRPTACASCCPAPKISPASPTAH